MIEEKNNKRNKIAKIVGITLGIILLLGISYALFRVTVNGKKINKITTGKFSLMITDLNDNPQYTLDDTYKNDLSSAINIEKAVPISDEEGKIQEEKYEFKLVNDGGVNASYELSLEDLDIEVDEERLSSSLVKYSLIKDGTEKIGTLDNRVIDSGLIGRGKEKVYTLRIWIKEEATREEAEDKVFSAHLKLNGEQYNGEISEYGEKIKEWDITPTIKMTYYDDGTLQELENDRYKGGTIVVSGTGEVPAFVYDDEFGQEVYNKTAITILEGNDCDSLEEFQFYDLEEDFGLQGHGTCGNQVVLKYSPRKIVIEDGITAVGYGAFFGTQVEEVIVAGSVKVLDDAFIDTFFLKKLVLNEGLEVLSGFEVSQFESLRIPSTVRVIENPLVMPNLKELYLPASVDYETETFNDLANNSIIYVETQAQADKLNSGTTGSGAYYDRNKTTVIVDASKFN